MHAGAIGLGDPGYSEKLAQQCYERAIAKIRRTVPHLVDVGLQCDERFSNDAVVQLVKEHAEKPLDALFLVQPSWGRPAIALQLCRAFPNLPMILYSPGGEIIDGVIRTIAAVTGAASTWPALRSNGIKFKHVWSVPGESIEEAAFLPFLRAAAAIRQLRGAKFGLVGFGDMRLQAMAFDIQELHRTFGVEVDAVDMLELQKEMNSLDERSLAEQTEMLTAAWKYHNGNKPPAETLKKVIGAYVVLDRWASERGWIGIDTKCVTGLAPHMGFTPCMTGSLLARKYFYQCENDIPGLLTQAILGLLSGTTTGYWELYEVLKDGLLMGCCGFCPESLLTEAVEVRVFGDYFPGMMGCCTPFKRGPYTLGRIGKNSKGEYLFHCFEGEGLEPPRWYEAAVGVPQHPSVRFVPEIPIARLLEQLFAQHVAVASGRWKESVVEFTTLAGIAIV
jgi:L-fucose isomerase-like protein